MRQGRLIRMRYADNPDHGLRKCLGSRFGWPKSAPTRMPVSICMRYIRRVRQKPVMNGFEAARKIRESLSSFPVEVVLAKPPGLSEPCKVASALSDGRFLLLGIQLGRLVNQCAQIP